LLTLEDKLLVRPAGRRGLRDCLGIGLLIVLAVILLPLWGIDTSTFTAWFTGNDAQRARAVEVLSDTGETVSSMYLLLALGFLVALRCGAIDLSVWVLAGLAGVAAAALINAGLPAWAALPVGVLLAACVGAVNAFFVAGLRLPSVIVTAATALAVLGLLRISTDRRSIPVPQEAFANWQIATEVAVRTESADEAPARETVGAPLSVTRKLIVAAVYALTLAVLASSRRRRRAESQAHRRAALFASLCASAALAGAGGVVWLLDYAAAPVPVRAVGDLRVVAAALLTGGAMLGGPGRTALTAVCLPPALLVSSCWMTEVWPTSASGFSGQMILLIAALVVAQFALVRAMAATERARLRAIAYGLLPTGALIALAFSPHLDSPPAREVVHWASVVACAAGTVGLLVDRRKSARQGAPRSGVTS